MVLATTGERRAPNARTAEDQQNEGKTERQLSAAAGAAIALMGLKQRGLGGSLMAVLGAALVHRGVSGHCYVYDALGMNTADGNDGGNGNGTHHRSDVRSAAATVNARKAVKIERSIAISKPRAELYRFWSDFENLPRFMSDLESVTELGNGRSRWVARGTGGARIEWDSEIVNDLPNELIAWKTVGDPDIAHAGSVHFKDTVDGLGTELRVVIDYEPPGGRLGAIGAKLTKVFGESPDEKIRQDLEQLKLVLERRGNGRTAADP